MPCNSEDVKGNELFPAEGEEGIAPEREEESSSQEARKVSAPRIPDTPSREEVLQHRLTHYPFRSWCPHCVRGKGRADRHGRSSQKDEVPNVPKLVRDYFFVGRKRALKYFGLAGFICG